MVRKEGMRIWGIMHFAFSVSLGSSDDNWMVPNVLRQGGPSILRNGSDIYLENGCRLHAISWPLFLLHASAHTPFSFLEPSVNQIIPCWRSSWKPPFFIPSFRSSAPRRLWRKTSFWCNHPLRSVAPDQISRTFRVKEVKCNFSLRFFTDSCGTGS